MRRALCRVEQGRWRGGVAKRVRAVLLVAFTAVLFGLPGVSSATLVKVGDSPMAYDPVTNLYWFTDLSLLNNKNYQQQQAIIASLSVAGYSGFHMAGLQEITSLLAAVTTTADLASFDPTSIITHSPAEQTEYLWTGRVDNLQSVSPEGLAVRQFYTFMAQPSLSDLISCGHSNLSDDSSFLPGEGVSLSAWVVCSKDPEPVPEPGSLALLVIGVAALIGYRWRMNRDRRD